MHAYKFTQAWLHSCIHAWMHVCMPACMHACTYAHTPTHMHTLHGYIKFVFVFVYFRSLFESRYFVIICVVIHVRQTVVAHIQLHKCWLHPVHHLSPWVLFSAWPLTSNSHCSLCECCELAAIGSHSKMVRWTPSPERIIRVENLRFKLIVLNVFENGPPSPPFPQQHQPWQDLRLPSPCPMRSPPS